MQPLRSFKFSTCCSTPEAIACLDFKWSKHRFRAHLMMYILKIAIKLIIKCIYIEMKQEVRWVQCLVKM